jgi:hypothetical protein
METNIQKPMNQQTLQQTVLAKQKQTAKPNKPANRSEYCQAAKPATMKPATAKGAGGRGEALRYINYYYYYYYYYYY